MKVLFVHRSPIGAFGEAAMQYFPACLARQGHEVSMVAKAGGECSFLVQCGVKVLEVEAKQSWLNVVRKAISDGRPDIVHTFLYSGCGVIPWIFRFMKRRPKFVLDIRSPLLRTGVFRFLHQVKNFIEPLGFDAITTHGIESARTQLPNYHKLYWLPPGVDTSIISVKNDAWENRNNQQFRLVYIGSLDSIRQVDRMLEAVVETAKKRNVKLDIFGEGDMLPRLVARVKEAGLTKVINFHGRKTRESILAELPFYDAGIAYIPGGIYETAPALKTLEYLACGLPVLATDTLGNRMFVNHGINGFLARADPTEFSRGICALINHDNLPEMRRNAMNSVVAYDWGRIVRERLIPLYDGLMSDYA